MENINIIYEYIPVIMMILAGLVVGSSFLFMSELLGARRKTKGKETTYESGMVPYGKANNRFSIKFYLTAVSFIVFDIEVVFLYPWAVQMRELGATPFYAMMVFIVILLIGLYYEIKKGGLQWD